MQFNKMRQIVFCLRKYIWVFIILILAGFLYFYKLDLVPNGFYIDEALPAYNAYSILKTGKDEYGKFLPVVFRFYGSYNPSLYTYLTVIPVYIFGLSVFSGRFISVFCGLTFGIVIYFFIISSKLKEARKLSLIGLITALVSPWIFFYSRIGYEVTLGLLLYTTGCLFLWKSLEKSKYLIWSAIFFSLSTYAAYSERFIAPLTIIAFLIIFRNKIFKKTNRNNLYNAAVLGIATQIPNLFILFTPAFFPKTNLIAESAVSSQSYKLMNIFPYFISFPLAWLREFLSQYAAYFSPKNLFFLPDPDLQRSLPDLSVFYPWMIVPFFAGLYTIYKENKNHFYKFLLITLFIAPIPAALTKDPFATHRALPLAFSLIIIITLGIYEIYKKINPKIFWLTTSAVFIISGIFLWRSYFVLFPNERASVWQYGFEQLAAEVEKRPGEHFIIDQARLKPAYINLAFYLKYPPYLFQKTVDQSVKNNYYAGTPFDDHYNFGQVETRNINWQTDIGKKQILVGDEYSISDSQAKEHALTKVFEIRDPLNRIVFEGFETNPEKLVPKVKF